MGLAGHRQYEQPRAKPASRKAAFGQFVFFQARRPQLPSPPRAVVWRGPERGRG